MHLLFHARPMPEQIPFTPMKYLHKKKKKKKLTQKRQVDVKILIKMIEISGKTVTVFLTIIFEESLQNAKFPDTWKKANTVPMYKKEDKILFKNYRPISLFAIFGKMFGMVMYGFLQSGFLT